MKGFRRIFAVITGMVLLLAGILKLMDPVGAGLVMDEYLKFFHLKFLLGASRFIAIVMALIESTLGAALMAGVWRRITAIASGGLLALFTLLTLLLYIMQPSMDCGCFGEAVHLGHGQTLLKNLILCALWCAAFIPLKNDVPPQKVKYVSFSIAAVSLVLFLLYSGLSIPLRDYADFKPGTELDEQPLYFHDAAREYVDSLAQKGPVMVLSVYNTRRIDEARLADFIGRAAENGFLPLLLCSTTPEEPGLSNPVLLSGCYFSDRKLLQTLNRSNGGVTYINDGLVIRKWATRSLPDDDELRAIKEKAPMDYLLKEMNRTRALFQGFLLYVFAVLLLL